MVITQKAKKFPTGYTWYIVNNFIANYDTLVIIMLNVSRGTMYRALTFPFYLFFGQ